MAFWLMKSEPDVFSIDDLAQCPDGTDHWDGIRNYMARNYMRDDMRVGDQVLFYHSNAKPPHVAGLAEIVSLPYPDHTARNPDSHYYDPKSTEDNPRWVMVDVRYVSKLRHTVSLAAVKANPVLSKMMLVTHGRLSICPVAPEEWNEVLAMSAQAETR